MMPPIMKGRMGAPRPRMVTVNGQRCVLKQDGRGAVWHRRGSPFYGGVGLVPPYRPLVHHEARAWARLSPQRVVFSGWINDVATVLLRYQDGEPLTPRGPATMRGFLTELTRALVPLHARGIVHRDLRPANLLRSGGAIVLLDLDVCLLDGLGPVGVVGSHPHRYAALLATNAPQTPTVSPMWTGGFVGSRSSAFNPGS
ncbi:MAG: hypothetical protein AAFV53_35915 [Myxococcota bacterium]